MKWIDEVFDFLEAGVVLAEKASEFLDRRRPLPKEESKAGLDGRQVSSKPSAPETSDLGEEPPRLHDFLWRNFGCAVILGYGVFLIAFLLFSRVWAIGLAYAAILSINVNLLREKSAYQGIPDVLLGCNVFHLPWNLHHASVVHRWHCSNNSALSVRYTSPSLNTENECKSSGVRRSDFMPGRSITNYKSLTRPFTS